jgi:UDP-N-acetyl-D-glucosamine dehydrogenase
VNIALANEFARHADAIGIDIGAVIAAANSQPYSHIHRPGVAVGGHCIPIYPRFYMAGDHEARLPAVAREVNDTMPAYAVDLLAAATGGLQGLRVAVLGAAYRGDVKELAFSGAFGVVAALKRAGAHPVVHDPLYTEHELRAVGFDPYRLGEPVDAALLQADHTVYRDLDPGDLASVAARTAAEAAADQGEVAGARARDLLAPHLATLRHG